MQVIEKIMLINMISLCVYFNLWSFPAKTILTLLTIVYVILLSVYKIQDKYIDILYKIYSYEVNVVLLHVFFRANAIMFLSTVQNQVMLLEVVIFLYFLDLLTKCAGDCQPTCNVTGWGSWSFCHANGTQTRDRAYCCPAGITTIDACLQNCSLTPESPDVQSCVYTDPSFITTQADNIVTHGSKYYF